jgi:hypothetical protein
MAWLAWGRVGAAVVGMGMVIYLRRPWSCTRSACGARASMCLRSRCS